MDIVLGVSMTPTSVRMVLVEGEKGDGLTVDHDAFGIASDDASATAAEQVLTAILGTRESAAEGGHRLVSTGVTWRDHNEAAALREALAARDIDDVMLVSELHAAGALAQAVGRAVGYDRTALMFLERDTVTVSVVDTVDGSIVKVQSQALHTADAVAELGAMMADLETLDAPPQGVFVVGSGVSVAAIKLQLESATSLPVSAPDEAELALARGAALASANAPTFEASTVGLAFANESAAATQMAGAGYMSGSDSLAYSAVDADEPNLAVFAPVTFTPSDEPAETSGRKPFLLVGSAMTSIFVIGVAALVISLAVSIRPTVDERPSPGESVIVPTEAAPAPQAQPPAAPAPPPETIPAPIPVVQEAPQAPAPRTVFAEAPVRAAPAPAAPAPAPEAPAPAAPAPAPAAPIPAPAPEAPPAVAPPASPYVPPPAVAPFIPAPVIVLPKPTLPPIFRPPWDRGSQRDNDYYDPPSSWPGQQPQQQWPQPQQQWPQQQQQMPDVPQSPQRPSQQWPTQQQQPQQQWPGNGSDSGSRNGSGSRGGSGSNGSIWPWPFGG